MEILHILEHMNSILKTPEDGSWIITIKYQHFVVTIGMGGNLTKKTSTKTSNASIH